MEFQPFPKIARLSRESIVTEKIDGTNAQVHIIDASKDAILDHVQMVADVGNFAIYAGSRTRYITPTDDNFGFAAWVKAHAEELCRLGEGRHYGEWWGLGIQRGYGQTMKRFSLFNVGRWGVDRDREKFPMDAPACCSVVPVLWRGEFDSARVSECVERLRQNGSVAAPGFMKPEGVVVFHAASGTLHKKTLEKDEQPKGKVA